MSAHPKRPREECRHLREMARHHGCSMRWSCSCSGNDTSTTVLAHSNSSADGKGLAMKAHDWAGVYACAACHSELDQGRSSREERRAAFEAGLARQARLYHQIIESPTSRQADVGAASWALERLLVSRPQLSAR